MEGVTGRDRTIDVTFPECRCKELAGKAAKFEVTAKKI